MTPDATLARSPNGPMAAALLAGGLGCATLGVLTTWAEASPELAESLNWWPPGGPLTGKAGAASATFFTAWAVLHTAWRRRNVAFAPVAAFSSLLLTVGLVGTFPPVFERVGERLHS